MYALNDALGMITAIHPEFAKLIAWKDAKACARGCRPGRLRRRQSISRSLGLFWQSGVGIIKGCRGDRQGDSDAGLVGETKNKALVVTHSPAERQTEGL